MVEEQPMTAAEKLRLIAHKQAGLRNDRSPINQRKYERESWAVAKNLFPISDEELPQFRTEFQRLSGQIQVDVYDAMHHNMGKKRLNELLGINRAPRRI